MNKGAFVKNQDAIYREATLRQRSRSTSPIPASASKPLRQSTINFASDLQDGQRTRSPLVRSALDLHKKHSIFSSESESDGQPIQ